MFFDELSDEEWTRVSTLIADEPIRLNRRGRPRAETRVVANAILWILTTGEPWSKLPGRYPSGPTCRRRFEEWLASGTLGEMVAMLTELSGRAFAYVPPPPELAVPAPRAEPVANNDRLRGVFWQNPESWRLPVAETDEWQDEEDEAGMRQTVREAPAAAVVQAELQAGAARAVLLAREARADAASAPVAGETTEHGDQGDHGEHPRPVSVRFATVAPQSEPYHGYTLYGTAQPVQNMMYRAWAEIAQDGRRVERSGLIGPRFSDPEAAERYAIAWGRDWVDHQLALEVQPDAAADAPREVHAEPVAAVASVPAPRAKAEAAALLPMRTAHSAAALATLSTLVPADRGNVRHFGTERRHLMDGELTDPATLATEFAHREFAYQIG
ncbi:transposase [Burkholderia gladioli]|uniref:transposase n=1 Tax=Burkholderia gladioli TaxID=28095 RepID=UPI000CDAAE3C|nr:transposase [Burkholderia gladioli]POS05760.1 transposase [Burkholderia gladioli]